MALHPMLAALLAKRKNSSLPDSSASWQAQQFITESAPAHPAIVHAEVHIWVLVMITTNQTLRV
jgi:hypothetical protein